MSIDYINYLDNVLYCSGAWKKGDEFTMYYSIEENVIMDTKNDGLVKVWAGGMNKEYDVHDFIKHLSTKPC